MKVSNILHAAAAAAAKSLQLCLTLCDPIDSSPPGSPVPGILQARTLEWVAISFSNAWKWKVKGKSLSCVRLFATPWTAAHQVPLSMGLSRREYWSGLPLPSPNILHRGCLTTNSLLLTIRRWRFGFLLKLKKSVRTSDNQVIFRIKDMLIYLNLLIYHDLLNTCYNKRQSMLAVPRKYE